MSETGYCNCGSISVALTEEQRANPLLCYCRNCKRAGGGYSVNYVVEEADISIQDDRGTLKTYIDTNTDSGNAVERMFCGDCGSPVFTRSPKVPGKGFLKGSLFDRVSAPSMEVYTAKRESWQPAIEGAVSK
ncbi:Mss4-like protein [Dactylonectria estremocensis]|uniref:Mss4-like protein n=1 Tax=Dactylonectria estremocensis TaxID=1079267 RepID=A0A9P9DGM6_9HYPO|nr:Mss4-like protein [Dactylonectria estremocensis]